MTHTGNIFLKIPSDKIYLGLVRKVIVDFAEKVGFDDIESSKIEMAVDEACANVIDHAYRNNESVTFHNYDNDIEIKIHVNKEKTIIDILDRGIYLDLNEKIQQLTSIETHLRDMNVSGLGLYVIRNFMDDISFSRTNDGYNKLSMTKLIETK